MTVRTPIAVLAKRLGLLAHTMPWTTDAVRHTTLEQIDQFRQVIVATADELWSLADSSIPGVQIMDPQRVRVFKVHERWPKCRFNSPEAAAARIARTTDPKVLATIKDQTVMPSTCNCEWCVVAQFGVDGEEYQAWLRAHRDARETWPDAYWHRLYPCLAFVGSGVKTEAEAFAA